MNLNELVTIIGGVIATINGASLIYFAWKKLKPEVKKMQSEVEIENISTANINLEGAKVSAQILLDRINELKGDLEAQEIKFNNEFEEERLSRKEELEKERRLWRDALESEKKAREKDAIYFRRRLKEADREARDYRAWAAKLAKQVVEAKSIPAPFIPTIDESSTDILAIRPELEEEHKEDESDK